MTSFPCVSIELTLVKVWENSKLLWKHSPVAHVSTAFLIILPNFTCVTILYGNTENVFYFNGIYAIHITMVQKSV